MIIHKIVVVVGFGRTWAAPERLGHTIAQRGTCLAHVNFWFLAA
jgi:hypothetical protein